MARGGSIILVCCLLAVMLNARTGEAMQFRGSDESSTSLDSANAAHQMPDENSAVADEDASHDMEAVDNDMEPPENDTDVDAASTVGEMDSNNEGASFVQQASKGEAMDSNASKGEMDSLDAEADPVDAVDDDAAAGDDSSVVGEEDGAVIERASENKDETIGGEPVDREIQPHYD